MILQAAVILVTLLTIVCTINANEAKCDASRDVKSFETMVKMGNWACALEYVSRTKPDDLLQLKTTLDMEHRRITSSILGLKSAIESSLPTASVVPAFQWCQSSTHIYLNIKFSHKLDAPATLNVETDDVTITDSHFRLLASAVKGSSKNFNLNFPFRAPIVPANSSYSMASVGRMSASFLKEKGEVKWPKLVLDTFNVQKQLGKSVLHFWHEQHDKYAKELDLLDDIDDDEDDRRRKRKAREERDKGKPELKKEVEEAKKSSQSDQDKPASEL